MTSWPPEAIAECERIATERDALKAQLAARAAPIDREALSHVIANELVAQDNEIDNLGDSESVVIMSKCPCINLVQLADVIAKHIEGAAA